MSATSQTATFDLGLSFCQTLGCENQVTDGRCRECREATPVPTATTYEDVCWSDTAEGRIPRSLNERERWMGAVVTDDSGKLPFAPWADQNHPDANSDEDARWKWSITDNYVDGDTLDSELRTSSEIKHRSFIQQEDSPNAHVDFDKVVDGNGNVHPAVPTILDTLGLTFTELSQSGTGIHALYQGELPDGVRQAGWDLDNEPFGENDECPSIEIYHRRRQLVVTGEHVRGTPAGVHSWDADRLHTLLIENNVLVEDDSPSVPSDEYDDFDSEEYDAEVTDSSTTTEIRDVFAAIDRLDAQYVAEKTIVHEWNDRASTSNGYRAFKPIWGRNSNGTANIVDDRIWHDTGGGVYGGPTVMAAIDIGEISHSTANGGVTGATWFKAVEHLRDLGFDIPEYVESTEDDSTPARPLPRTCEPPELKERVPFDAESEREVLTDDEYEAFTESSRPVVWSHPCGWGKTTSAALGGDKRDRTTVHPFATHEKAHEFINDDVTPEDIFHLKGPTWPRRSVCMDACCNDDPCPDHDDQCPLMCSLYERDSDDPLRQKFERLKGIMGPISAHNYIDPHGGEKCDWLAQFDELKSHDMVACVHEHQIMKTLSDERDVLIDESTRLLKTEYSVCVEEILNAAETLDEISSVDENYSALAEFARRLADSVRTDDEPDTEPPSIDSNSSQTTTVAETLAEIRINFNEHLRSEIEQDRTPSAKTGVIDVIIGFASSCGLDKDACAKALGGVKSLHHCPWCGARFSRDESARTCENDGCGWTEGEDTYLPPDAERARFTVHKRTGADGRSEAVIESLPNKSNLPDNPLLLDATATPTKIEGMYGTEPTTVGDDHDIAMNMDVTQITSGAYHGSTIKNTESLQRKFQTIIGWACKKYDKPLFGGKKDVLKTFDFPENACTVHFGGLRGLNYDECNAVFALGAPHWYVSSLKRDAELLCGGIAIDNGLEVGGKEYSARRTEDGEFAANPPEYRKLLYEDENGDGLEVPAKEFSGMVGDLFREKREAELQQFIHRTRPITSEETVDVYLLTNVPTDIPVDDVMELDTLVDHANGRDTDIAQLDVPDGAKDLLEGLDDSETFTRSELQDQVSASDSTVKKWIISLMDCGAIESTGETKLRSELLTVTN